MRARARGNAPTFRLSCARTARRPPRALTGGPPISYHSSTRSERGRPFSRRSHRIDTRPFLVESSPYFDLTGICD